MNTQVLFAVIAFFGLVIIARFILEAGYKRLDALQKAAVLDSHSALRKYSLVGVLGVVILGSHRPAFAAWIVISFFIMMFSYSYYKVRIGSELVSGFGYLLVEAVLC